MSLPLSILKKTLSSLETSTEITSLSGVDFSETEDGESITLASCGLNEAVSIKNVKSKENKSTIGVISTCGCALFSLIFAMSQKILLLIFFKVPDYFVVEANVWIKLKPDSSILKVRLSILLEKKL